MDLVASHQRLLVGCALRTEGPVLELGVGFYSTPLLHEITAHQKRDLVTLDNNEHWLEEFKATKWAESYGLRSKHHRMQYVEWWDQAKLTPAEYKITKDRWGLVFVDHGPPIERYYVINRLLNENFKDWEPGVFLFHDTEDPHPYGYDRLLPRFKYRWTDTCHKAHTTVASNFYDITKWFTKLPPVQPSEEVT